MKRNDVAGLKECLLTVNSLHSGGLDDILRTISIEGIHLHTEAGSDAGYVATYITKGEDSEFLAHEL